MKLIVGLKIILSLMLPDMESESQRDKEKVSKLQRTGVELPRGRMGFVPDIGNEPDCFHEEGTKGMVCEKFLRPCRYHKSREECKIRIVIHPTKVEEP